MRFDAPPSPWFDFAGVGLRGREFEIAWKIEEGETAPLGPFGLIWDIDEGTSSTASNVGDLVSSTYVGEVLLG